MSPVMNVRRKLALAIATAAVAVPALSACNVDGFDYATDRPNVIANGGYHTDGDVHVLAARIIAPSDGTGTFVATITTDASTEPVEFVGLSGVTTSKFAPVTVGTHSAVNLYTEGGISVTGDFKAGQVVPVTLSFADGNEIEVRAIVVTQCHEYAHPAIAGEGSSTKAKASAAASAEAAHDEADAATLNDEAAHDSGYSCDYATGVAHGSEH